MHYLSLLFDRRSKDFLLNNTACDNAETWQEIPQTEKKQPVPTQLQQEFVQESRRAIEKANRRKNALLASAVGGLSPLF